jgi:hypothetical protein
MGLESNINFWITSWSKRLSRALLPGFYDGKNQCYGSRMFIPDPDFLPIPYLGSKNLNKRVGWKKICCHTFFLATNFTKIVNYFLFEMLKKKIWPSFQRIIEFFSQNLSPSSKKWGFGIRDPGSVTLGKWCFLFSPKSCCRSLRWEK